MPHLAVAGLIMEQFVLYHYDVLLRLYEYLHDCFLSVLIPTQGIT